MKDLCTEEVTSVRFDKEPIMYNSLDMQTMKISIEQTSSDSV